MVDIFKDITSCTSTVPVHFSLPSVHSQSSKFQHTAHDLDASDHMRVTTRSNASTRRTIAETPDPQTRPMLSPPSAVSPQREGVVAFPRLSAASLRLAVAVALVETAGALAGGGETARLAV